MIVKVQGTNAHLTWQSDENLTYKYFIFLKSHNLSLKIKYIYVITHV